MSYQLPPSLLLFKGPYVFSKARTSFDWQGCLFEGPDVYSIQRLEISSPIKSSVLTEGTASFSFKLKNGVSYPNPYLFSLKTFLKLVFRSPKNFKNLILLHNSPRSTSNPPNHLYIRDPNQILYQMRPISLNP